MPASTVAVTGAAGFVGRALVARLLESGVPVRAIVREAPRDTIPGVETIEAGDLAKADLPRLIEGCGAVVNLAARVHVTRETEADPDAAYRRLNFDLPLDLARAAHCAGVRRFVQMSSVAAIQSVTPPGVVLDDAAPPRPRTPYGTSKLDADVALEAFARDHGLSAVSLRPPALFGPGVGAHFRRLMRWARRGVPLPLGGIGNARSFMYVENLADAAAAALAGDAQGAFIVTDSRPLSTAELYRRLLRAYGRRERVPKLAPILVSAAARALLRGRADSVIGSSAFDGERFAETFRWTPPVGLDEGIRRTVDSDETA